MPIVWTDNFPLRERPLGYLRLLQARHRYHAHFGLGWKGWRPSLRRAAGDKYELGTWKNKFQGKRCFVMGNGPSLRDMDMSLLKDEITIGCNGIYRNFSEWGWHVNYLLFEDIEQTEIRRHDIHGIKGPIKVAGLHNAYAFKADEDTHFMNVRNLDVDFMENLFPQFSKDFGHQVHLAGTVTYIGLQLAFHLGCDPVYLIGVDHDYGELPRLFPPCKITITEDNIHLVRGLHVKQDYYKVGDTIGVPAVEYMDAGYAKAREVYEAHGRSVINAGLNSALDTFEKTEFITLFTQPQKSTTEAMPKILFISHDAGLLGAQVSLLNIVGEFNRRYGWGCRIVIREPNGTLIPRFEAEGETHIFWPNPDAKQLGDHQISLSKQIAAWNPDVVYSNTTSNGDVIDYLDLDAPTVVHTHELEWYLSLLDEDRHRIFVEKTDLHIACSNAVKLNLIENHEIEAAGIEIVYEAINFDDVQHKAAATEASAVRKQLGIPEEAILIGNCGRIDERKGWDLFIDAAQKVIESAPEDTPVHFIWVGHGPNHQDLLEAAKSRGIADCVHAPGPQENPFPYFKAMDVEAMCSRDDPFPLVVMESAFLGCPVIAFAPAGGAQEFIGEDCGIIIPEISADGLATAILKLVNDADLRARLGQNAQARAAAEFDIKQVSPRIARILHQRLGLPLPKKLQTKRTTPAPSKPQPTKSDDTPPDERTLTFPGTRSFGKLQLRSWGASSWDWKDLGDAKGTVAIPQARETYLILDNAAAPDLSPLGDLDANALQSISMAHTDVVDEQLVHISTLTDLRTLDLRQTPITDAGINTLTKMTSLRAIVLPPQISDQALAQIKATLPNTNITREEGPPVLRPDAAQLHAANTRTVTFPDKAFGLLMTRSWGLPIWSWQELGPAKGTVTVTPNRELLLVVYPEWKDDLSPLAKLDPNDLQSLHLRPATIDDDQLAHVAHLTGLKTLDLRDTNITAGCISQLRSLTNLKQLWLPEPIAESARAELKPLLRNCRFMT